ncbi:uncharacterized protein Pyn_21145 [Prunus yedoensis var. nudiflora]|uniref:Uncharacterized protein n=1 Tax=Prunus yedoensis var. nudiflora TaxID=2094558 RepID=A0A314XMQ0_PRUYE|nr:uncharacterized protein Pyn_21145 [Prunus yedoensis var. nudiflora]
MRFEHEDKGDFATSPKYFRCYKRKGELGFCIWTSKEGVSNGKAAINGVVFVLQCHLYQVVRRKLPTASDEHPKIYRIKLWATNEVFLRKLKKVKKSNGQVLAINEWGSGSSSTLLLAKSNLLPKVKNIQAQLACAVAHVADPNEQASKTNLNQALETNNEQATVVNAHGTWFGWATRGVGSSGVWAH